MSIFGLCAEKCPEKEREFRVKNHLLHPLECHDPFGAIPARKRRPVVGRICKSYSRPAASQIIEAEQVRTPTALKQTADYLVDVEREFRLPSQWPLVYEFLVDRFRSIRQDITVQQLRTSSATQTLESMILFYIRADLRSRRTKTPTYDSTLHLRELEDCFGCWTPLKNKSEEVQILFYLYSARQPTIFNVLNRQTSSIRLVLWRLFLAISNQNYVAFFRFFDQLEDTMQKSILWSVVGEMRLNALKVLASSTRSPNCSIPLVVLRRWLGFPGESELCDCLNEISDQSVIVGRDVKFHGVKLKRLDVCSLGYSWTTFEGSEDLS